MRVETAHLKIQQESAHPVTFIFIQVFVCDRPHRAFRPVVRSRPRRPFSAGQTFDEDFDFLCRDL